VETHVYRYCHEKAPLENLEEEKQRESGVTTNRRLGCAEGCSIDLDRAVDGAHEEKRRNAADGSSQEHEGQRGNAHPPKVDKERHRLGHLQLGEEIENRVQEDEACARSRDEEGAPPPAPILSGQLEVRQGDGDLGARHNEDNENQEKEAKEVVELVLPDGRHDEEHLRKDGAERQHSSNQRHEDRVQEPRLIRDRPRGGGNAHWDRQHLLAEAESGAKEEAERRCRTRGRQEPPWC